MRLSVVSAGLGLASPLFVARLEEALEVGADRAILFVDLSACASEVHAMSLLQTWDAFRPGSEIILFTPLIDRERELRIVAGVCRSARSAEVRVMTASDFYRDEVWRNLGEMRENAALEAEFRAEFLAAVRQTGRPLRAEPAVLMVLHDAPRAGEIIATAEMPLDQVRAAMDSDRKALWKFLRQSGQLPASWLLLIFRVLWYTKLRERGWSAGRIATFLGFDSPRQFRLTIKRRFGIALGQLKAIRYPDALVWAADLVTSAHVRLARQPVRALVGSLVAPSDKVVVPGITRVRQAARDRSAAARRSVMRRPKDG